VKKNPTLSGVKAVKYAAYGKSAKSGNPPQKEKSERGKGKIRWFDGGGTRKKQRTGRKGVSTSLQGNPGEKVPNKT